MEEQAPETPPTQKPASKEGFVLVSKKTMFYLVGVIVVFLCFFVAVGIIFLYLFFGNKKTTQNQPIPPKKPKKLKSTKPKENTSSVNVEKKEDEIKQETTTELINAYSEVKIPSDIIIPSESEQEQDVKADDEN